MRIAAVVCITVLAAAAAGQARPAKGPVLFEGARLGMSVAEVRRAVPDARQVSRKERNFDEQHRLAITHRMRHGVRLHVQFWFGAHGLSRVVETSEGLDRSQPLSADTVRAVSRDLAREFGEPVICRLRQPSGDIASCRYVRGRATAILAASPEDGPPRLRLIFRAARDEDDADDGQ